MGFTDRLLGRTPAQRAKRAEKIRKKFADTEGMTPELLEALTTVSDMPTREDIKLYLSAVPAGARPRRVMKTIHLGSGTRFCLVLFDDGLTLRSGRWEGKEFRTSGADLPFWGVHAISGHKPDGLLEGIVLRGSDGQHDYHFGIPVDDYKEADEVLTLANELLAAYRARPADRQARAATVHHDAPPVDPRALARPEPLPDGGVRVTITDDMTAEQKLAQLEHLRAAGFPPDQLARMRQQFEAERRAGGPPDPS